MSGSKLVWRVQLPNGDGMYHAGVLDCTQAMNYDLFSDDMHLGQSKLRHPCPRDDYMLAPHWNALRNKGEYKWYIFGFADVDQLLSWVYKNEWHQEIHNTGFKVYVYSVPDAYVCIGATQACFHHVYGELISVVDIIDLT